MFRTFFVLVWTINYGICDVIPVFTCIVAGDGSSCQVDIFQNESNPHFSLSAPEPKEIVKVAITNSNISIWTADVCNYFVKLDLLIVKNSGVKRIEENAFENCTKLRQLSFYNNSITRIEAKTFQPLTRLTLLRIDVNKLTDFDFDLLKGLNNLEEIDLDANEILDIDEQKVLKYFPKLETLRLEGNKFLCGRQENINDAMHRHNNDVHVSKSDFCLDASEWKNAFLKADKESQQKIIKVLLATQSYLFEYINLSNKEEIEHTKEILAENIEKLKRHETEMNKTMEMYSKMIQALQGGQTSLPLIIVLVAFLLMFGLVAIIYRKLQNQHQNPQVYFNKLTEPEL